MATDENESKPTEPKRIRPKVHLFNLLAEMSNTCGDFTTKLGVRMVVHAMSNIAVRACELNDPKLLEELEVLCLVGPDNNEGEKKG